MKIVRFLPENNTSLFAETYSSLGEVASVLHRPLYLNPLVEIVVEEEAVRRVVLECVEARSESNDAEEVIDVLGGGEAGLISGVESEGFTFVDAMSCANLFAASDPQTVIDTSGMPTCKYYLVR